MLYISACPAGGGIVVQCHLAVEHNTPVADNQIKENNAIKLSVGDYDDGARTGAVPSRNSLRS